MQLLQNYYKTPRDRKVFSLLILIMITFFILRTIELDRIGTQNFEYNSLEEKIRKIKVINSELSSEILYEQSLGRIEQKAGEAGLTEKATFYILK